MANDCLFQDGDASFILYGKSVVIVVISTRLIFSNIWSMHKQWNVNTTIIMRTMTIVHKFTVIAGSKIDYGFSFQVSMHPVTLVVVALKINVVYCPTLLVYIKAYFKVV